MGTRIFQVLLDTQSPLRQLVERGGGDGAEEGDVYTSFLMSSCAKRDVIAYSLVDSFSTPDLRCFLEIVVDFVAHAYCVNRPMRTQLCFEN